MGGDDLPFGHADGPGGFDVFLPPDGEHGGPGHPDEGGGTGDAHGQHQVKGAFAQGGYHGNGHEHAGDGGKDVAHPHGHVLEHAADVAGGSPQGHPEHQGEHHRDDAHGQGIAGAVADPGEDIPAHVVGAEPVFRGGGLHAFLDVVGDDLGLIIEEVGGTQGHHDDDHQ